MTRPDATLLRVEVRSPAPAEDARSARRALEEVDWRVRSLPPSAILVVRRLETPPRSAHVGAGWREAVTDRLDAVARRAARPALGQHSDEAVWFADPAELLAVLLTLYGTGRAAWWTWRLTAGPSAATAAPELLAREVEHLPVALDRLARSDALRELVTRLDEHAVRAMIEALVLRFGLHELAMALQSAPTQRPELGEPRPVTAPFAPWAPELPEAAPPASRLAVGLALGLARAPRRVRERDFAHATRRWLDATVGRNTGVTAVTEDERAEAPPARPARSAARVTPDQAPPIDVRPAPTRAGEPDPAPGLARPAPAEHAPAAPAPPRASALRAPTRGPPPPPDGREGAALPPVVAAAAAAPDDITILIHDDPPRDPVVSAPSPPAPASPPTPGPAPRPASAGWPAPTWSPVDAQAELPEPIPTALGGAFYLVNLALYLGLYNDFSAPLDPGIGLPFWDWLEQVAWRLHPDADPADALWPLLRRLAGRAEGEAVGGGWLPPSAWEVPATWLRPFRARAPWGLSRAGGRVQLWHPAGFCALDDTCSVEAARARFEAPQMQAAAARPAYDGTLDAWLQRLDAYLRARLLAALPQREPWTVLLQPGLVLLSSARIEVVFALDTHPIDVRLAGLDRDPGWIPAAGRDIRFRYA